MDQLSVPQVGSRWANVTWQTPRQSNGVMTGYVLVALVASTKECASAVMFNCTDCNVTMVMEQVRTLCYTFIEKKPCESTQGTMKRTLFCPPVDRNVFS